MANIYNTRLKYEALKQIWQAAAESEGDWEMPMISLDAAKKLRLELYACIRRARKDKFADPELVRIAEDRAITIQGLSVVIYSRTLTNFSQNLIEDFGEQQGMASAGRVLERLAKEGIVVEEPVKGTVESGYVNPYEEFTKHGNKNTGTEES